MALIIQIHIRDVSIGFGFNDSVQFWAVRENFDTNKSSFLKIWHYKLFSIEGLHVYMSLQGHSSETVFYIFNILVRKK